MNLYAGGLDMLIECGWCGLDTICGYARRNNHEKQLHLYTWSRYDFLNLYACFNDPRGIASVKCKGEAQNVP